VNSNFLEPGELRDDDLELVCVVQGAADVSKGLVPWYEFSMRYIPSGEHMGKISLRLSNAPRFAAYAGHIGYNVYEPFRGHRYAARAVRLLFPLAKAHGLNPLWITCGPENSASRRTCELAGGVLEEIKDLPRDTDLYERGERRVCRYKFDL